MSVLSRSSDLTRFRLAKIEPEPLVPLRVQSVGPRDWVPPTLEAVKAWGEIELPKVNDQGSRISNFYSACATIYQNSCFSDLVFRLPNREFSFMDKLVPRPASLDHLICHLSHDVIVRLCPTLKFVVRLDIAGCFMSHVLTE